MEIEPLLLFIEPQAAAIWQNSNIQGIQSFSSEDKVSLYADDLLLYLQSPRSSLQETFNVINHFSKVSNYTVNWKK